MTTPADDPAAGVSLRKPRGVYSAALPDVGTATLLRPRFGELASVTLQLTPDAVARAKAAGAPAVGAVSFPLRSGGAAGWEADPRAGALRLLLVERALLSHPAWLRDEAPPADLTDDERWTLGSLRATLARRLDLAAEDIPLECEACRDQRNDGARRELAALEQALITRKRDGKSLSWRDLESLSNQVWKLRSGLSHRPPEGPCAHAEPAARGLAALVSAHEELAFELAGLLTASPDGARFVLGHPFETVILPRWLTGRAREGGGWYRTYTRRQPPRRRAVSWTGLRDRARAADELPPEQREAVAYAATAWAITAPLGALGWVPPPEPVASPALRADADEAPLEVAAQVPSFAVKRAPPPAAKKEPSKLPAGKPAAGNQPSKPPAGKPAAKKKPAAAPAVRAVTREVLRAVGLTDELIDEMVREGRLVEVGEGQYAHPAELKKRR